MISGFQPLSAAKRTLCAAGFGTVMTRKGDYFVGLDERNRISNRHYNAIFVSVHLNESRPKPYVHGVETYYHSGVSAELARRILGKVGAVSGVVAAAGGLGGYFPPLVMGATYHPESNSYSLGLWLLVLVGAFALVVAGMLRDVGRKA